MLAKKRGGARKIYQNEHSNLIKKEAMKFKTKYFGELDVEIEESDGSAFTSYDGQKLHFSLLISDLTAQR